MEDGAVESQGPLRTIQDRAEPGQAVRGPHCSADGDVWVGRHLNLSWLLARPRPGSGGGGSFVP